MRWATIATASTSTSTSTSTSAGSKTGAAGAQPEEEHQQAPAGGSRHAQQEGGAHQDDQEVRPEPRCGAAPRIEPGTHGARTAEK